MVTLGLSDLQKMGRNSIKHLKGFEHRLYEKMGVTERFKRRREDLDGPLVVVCGKEIIHWPENSVLSLHRCTVCSKILNFLIILVLNVSFVLVISCH